MAVTRRIAVALLVTGFAVALAVCFWPQIRSKLSKVVTDPSLIVAGVPAQVESYYDKLVPSGKTWVRMYWLGLEQCPADISSAEHGQYTQSFDPRVGIRKPECNFDWVQVTGSTYGSVTVGGTVTFEGTVGEPLRK